MRNLETILGWVKIKAPGYGTQVFWSMFPFIQGLHLGTYFLPRPDVCIYVFIRYFAGTLFRLVFLARYGHGI